MYKRQPKTPLKCNHINGPKRVKNQFGVEKEEKEDKVICPNIAQLAERLTVEVTQKSGGPWFESGYSDIFVNNSFKV